MTIVIKSDKQATNSLGRLEEFGIWGHTQGIVDIGDNFSSTPILAVALHRVVPGYTGYTAKLEAFDGATSMGSAKVKASSLTPQATLYELDSTADSRGVTTLEDLAANYTVRVVELYNQGSLAQKTLMPTGGSKGPIIYDGSDYVLIGSVMSMQFGTNVDLNMQISFTDQPISHLMMYKTAPTTDVEILMGPYESLPVVRHQIYLEAGNVKLIAGGSGVDTIDSAVAGHTANYMLAYFDGASSSIYIGNTETPNATGSLDGSQWGGLSLGAHSGNNFFQGKIAGLISFSSNESSGYIDSLDTLEGALVD